MRLRSIQFETHRMTDHEFAAWLRQFDWHVTGVTKAFGRFNLFLDKDGILLAVVEYDGTDRTIKINTTV